MHLGKVVNFDGKKLQILSPKKLKSFLQHSKIKKFRQKLNFNIDLGDYSIKTAETPEELLEVLKLRHSVFVKEWSGDIEPSDDSSIDFDKFDNLADHILLFHKKENRAIGTYRVLCSKYCDQFYSEKEFHMDEYLKQDGIKLELGRACIHKDHRRSIAIHLIWKGLGMYTLKTDADLMFGCTSIITGRRLHAEQIIKYLTPKHYSTDFNISARPKFNKFIEGGDFQPLTEEQIPKMIPTLMKSYMKAGAKFYGQPAYDADMATTDIFTSLNLKSLSETYKKRYLSDT